MKIPLTSASTLHCRGFPSNMRSQNRVEGQREKTEHPACQH